MDKQPFLQNKMKLPEHLCEAEDPLSRAKSYTLELMLQTERVAGSEVLNQLKDWIRTIDPKEVTSVLAQNKKFHMVAEDKIPFITADLRRLIRKNQFGYQKNENNQPKPGPEPGSTTSAPLEVDNFLFDDLQDALEAQDLHSDRVCSECSSTDITELALNFISYSPSALANLFGVVLPDLQGKKVSVIGSKDGSLVYGACLFSNSQNIQSYVESSAWAQVQKKIILKHGLSSRASVNVIHMDFNELIKTPIDNIASSNVLIFDDVSSLVNDNKKDVFVDFVNRLKSSLAKNAIVVCKNRNTTESEETENFELGLDDLPWLKRVDKELSSGIFNVYKII